MHHLRQQNVWATQQKHCYKSRSLKLMNWTMHASFRQAHELTSQQNAQLSLSDMKWFLSTKESLQDAIPQTICALHMQQVAFIPQDNYRYVSWPILHDNYASWPIPQDNYRYVGWPILHDNYASWSIPQDNYRYAGWPIPHDNYRYGQKWHLQPAGPMHKAKFYINTPSEARGLPLLKVLLQHAGPAGTQRQNFSAQPSTFLGGKRTRKESNTTAIGQTVFGRWILNMQIPGKATKPRQRKPELTHRNKWVSCMVGGGKTKKTRTHMWDSWTPDSYATQTGHFQGLSWQHKS